MKSEEFQRRYGDIIRYFLGKAITEHVLYSMEYQFKTLINEVKACGQLTFDIDRIRVMHRMNLTQKDFDDPKTREMALECDGNPSMVHSIPLDTYGNPTLLYFQPSICEELGMAAEGKLVNI